MIWILGNEAIHLLLSHVVDMLLNQSCLVVLYQHHIHITALAFLKLLNAHLLKLLDAIVSIIIKINNYANKLFLGEGNLCTDGSVRLVNGSIYQEGRVEVCVDGVWGSVCSSGWDTTDARVICKQLGYPNSGI